MKTLDIEIDYFDINYSISVKVPEGALTMTVAHLEEYDVGGEDDFGNYHSGVIYKLSEVKDVKLNGEKSDVYTDKRINEMLADCWSISCVEERGYDDSGRY